MKASKRDHRVYLQDILSAITQIAEYTTGGEEVFLADTKTQDAVLRQFSIVGEAAAKLPTAMRTSHPDIPWKMIIGMRNFIIHEYSEVKLKRIWETIERDLSPLKNAIQAMLREKAA